MVALNRPPPSRPVTDSRAHSSGGAARRGRARAGFEKAWVHTSQRPRFPRRAGRKLAYRGARAASKAGASREQGLGQWGHLIFKTNIPRYRTTNLNIFCEYINVLVEVCSVILPFVSVGGTQRPVPVSCTVQLVPRLPPWRATLTSSAAPRTRTTRPRRRRRRATPSTTTRPRTRRVIERIVHGRRASTCAPRTSTYNSHNSRTSTYNSGRRSALNN